MTEREEPSFSMKITRMGIVNFDKTTSNQPCQFRSTDYWADDTIVDV